MLTERTRTSLGFVALAILPAAVWLTTLSVASQNAQADIVRIKAVIKERREQQQEFQADVIDRLARIETLLDSRRKR